MSRRRALLALTAAAVVVTVPITPGPARVLVVTAFVLVAPGLAWTPHLPLHGVVEEATVAVALSLALTTVVATALLVAGVGGLLPAVLLLAGITVAG
ncbi:MAG TPA: hypothetical protein PKA98_20425, partial [Acidimicrobiales bacterium]|nr:hypothetical protein [Acidimicrobiales bacterium]